MLQLSIFTQAVLCFVLLLSSWAEFFAHIKVQQSVFTVQKFMNTEATMQTDKQLMRSFMQLFSNLITIYVDLRASSSASTFRLLCVLHQQAAYVSCCVSLPLNMFLPAMFLLSLLPVLLVRIIADLAVLFSDVDVSSLPAL
jgi:hypothetical protein